MTEQTGSSTSRFENVRLMAGEAVAGREFARLAIRAPELARARRGSGQPVVLIPGYRASDLSNAPLRRYLRSLGYDARGWGLGRNQGEFAVTLPQMRELTTELVAESGQQVHLVGWSLGGVMARAVARSQPASVAQVITYGSPIMDRDRSLVGVPITAIYSRADGVVPWRHCIDTFSPDIEHIEVRSAHLGMGIDPDVWRIITDRLARPRAPAYR